MKISKYLVMGALLSATMSGVAFGQPGMGREGRGPGRRLERMAQELNLTAAQKTQVSKIMEENRVEMQKLREKTKRRIAGVLNADQRKKLEEMKARGPQGRPGQRAMGAGLGKRKGAKRGEL